MIDLAELEDIIRVRELIVVHATETNDTLHLVACSTLMDAIANTPAITGTHLWVLETFLLMMEAGIPVSYSALRTIKKTLTDVGMETLC